MLFLMFVSFYTSRVILDKLGVQDFGIHNVVGGMATLFVFFRSSLSNVTQRYLNVEMGRGNLEEMKNVFCQHQTLYILIALVVFVIAETIGLWIVSYKLVIPPERKIAAMWVYQFTIISLMLTILSVVYDAAIIAHENMKIYSYVGIVEGMAKLMIAYSISVIPFDRLTTYAFLLMLVSVGLRIFYSYFCKTHYKECRYHFLWEKQRIKKIFSMVGWNTIGTAVWAVNSQGVNILLNIFCGPAVNAARGIAYQVNHAINNFGTQFYTSVRPQLVKSYASGNYDDLYKLFFSSSKYSVFLLWIFCLPMMLCVDTVLGLWLTTVPEHTGIFTILVLVYSLVNNLNNPIWSLALAIGELKQYVLIGSTVFLMSFPISWIFLFIGYPPESVFIVNIIVRSAYIYVVLMIINRYIPISLIKYFKSVLFPIIAVVTCSGSLSLMTSLFLTHSIVDRMIVCVICVITTILSIFTVGINNHERLVLITQVKKRLRR